jgi:thioredoxin:protein disulfide reductase
MKMPLFALLLLGIAGVAGAKPWWMHGVESNESDFLPPDAAFRVSAQAEGNLIRVRWVIAEGYYLYRSRIEIKAQSPDLQLATPIFPQGKVKVDPYFGAQQIYEQQLEATAAYTRSDFGAHPLEIKVTYQGCAEAGLCYPPITKVLTPGYAAGSAQGPELSAPSAWEGWAIGAGGAAFLLAGLLLRKGRKLDLPAS